MLGNIEWYIFVTFVSAVLPLKSISLRWRPTVNLRPEFIFVVDDDFVQEKGKGKQQHPHVSVLKLASLPTPFEKILSKS